MKIYQFIISFWDAQPFGVIFCHSALYGRVSDEIEGFPTVMRYVLRIDIDMYISAEIPRADVDPECYRVVSELTMHGPIRYPHVCRIIIHDVRRISKGVLQPDIY